MPNKYDSRDNADAAIWTAVSGKNCGRKAGAEDVTLRATTQNRRSSLWISFTVILVVSLIIGCLAPVKAQYYGQNKVNYEAFDWYYIKSEHFDIYHPRDAYEIAEFTAETAEKALIDIQKSWGYKLQGRITFVVYPNHNSFQATNVGSGSPSESTGGFTEFLKNRVVLPFQGSYAFFRHTIHHELTHAVMLRMLFGEGMQSILSGLSRMPLPLWFIEGLAEYQSSYGWTNEADLYIRDAVINDYLPDINRVSGYFYYKGGQSMLYYLDQRYGEEKVGELLKRIRSHRDFNRAVKATLGVDVEELSKRWHRDLKRDIWPSAANFESPEDFAVKVTDHRKWFNFVNTSPALSPDGDKLIILSDKNDYLSIYLVSTVTGNIEERLVRGERFDVFEQLLWMRPWIGWSPDGREIVFVAESSGEDALYTLDVEHARVTRKISFGLDGVFSPVWSPDGTRIAFAGYKGGQSDLYVVDLVNGNTLSKITDDIFSDYDPNWSPDCKSLLFTSDRGDYITQPGDDFTMSEHDYDQIDIYSIDLASSAITRLTDDRFEDRNPAWTSKPDTISFVSDRNGACNLYLMDAGSGESWAVTNILTNVVQPSWSNAGTVSFTSFHDAGYDVYLYKNPFDPERVQNPTLTHFQKKQRGLLDEDREDGEESRDGQLEDSTSSSPRHLVSRKAEPGFPGDTAGENEADSEGEGASGTDETGTDDVTVIITSISDDTFDDEPSGSSSTTRDAEVDSSGSGVEPDQAGDGEEGEAEDSTLIEDRGRPRDMPGDPYRKFIFTPDNMNYDTGRRKKSAEAKKKEVVPYYDEEGNYIQRKYKLKLSPDMVYAAAGYDTYFGLQGYGQIVFSDILGNHMIFLGTDLYYSFENSNFNLFYFYLPHRLDVGGGLFHNVYFFNYGRIRDRNYGVSLSMSYPLSKYKRIEFSGAFVNIDRDVWVWTDSRGADVYDYVQWQKRHFVIPSIAYVSDNSLWGYTGPMNGRRWRASFTYSPKFSDDNPDNLWGVDFKTLALDARQYYHVGLDYVFALRAAGAVSWGEHPQKFFLGGVNNWINRRFAGGDIKVDIDDIYFSSFATPLRGSNYYERYGNRYVLTNTEFRFPLIRQLLFGWPLPFFFYNVRGALFLDAGAAWNDDNFRGVIPGEWGRSHFGSILLGYGWGARINLGIFLLKFDVAWRNHLSYVSKPQYLFSIGTDL